MEHSFLLVFLMASKRVAIEDRFTERLLEVMGPKLIDDATRYQLS